MIRVEIVEMLSLQSICFQLMRLAVCLFDVIWESGSYVDNQDRSIVINRRAGYSCHSRYIGRASDAA